MIFPRYLLLFPLSKISFLTPYVYSFIVFSLFLSVSVSLSLNSISPLIPKSPAQMLTLMRRLSCFLNILFWILFFVVLNLFFFFKLLFTSYQLYEFGCPFRGFFFLQSQTSHYLFLCFHGPEALWFLNLSVISQAKVPLEDE